MICNVSSRWLEDWNRMVPLETILVDSLVFIAIIVNGAEVTDNTPTYLAAMTCRVTKTQFCNWSLDSINWNIIFLEIINLEIINFEIIFLEINVNAGTL